ncbi:hypothetical protein HDV00_000497 [Rhizophlyctis rosea]|nr:hypothetical protein HDV00_000497 [Rhizophlyctis rosea]
MRTGGTWYCFGGLGGWSGRAAGQKGSRERWNCIGVGQTIPRLDVKNKVVRDLIDTCIAYIPGVYAHGKVLLHGPRDRVTGRIGTIFVESGASTSILATPSDVHSGVSLRRTNLLLRPNASDPDLYVVEDSINGTKIATVFIPVQSTSINLAFCISKELCGPTLITHTSEKASKNAYNYITTFDITHIKSSTDILHPQTIDLSNSDTTRFAWQTYNEHFFAYAERIYNPHHYPAEFCIHLLRLTDLKEISQCVVSADWLQHLYFTRFNLPAFHTSEDQTHRERGFAYNFSINRSCSVFSLPDLKLLHTIGNLPKSRIWVTSNDYLISDCQGGFRIWDPFTKEVRDWKSREDEEGWGEVKGYSFVMMEYPLDKAGRRTGQRGAMRACWREVKCCEFGEWGMKCPDC